MYILYIFLFILFNGNSKHFISQCFHHLFFLIFNNSLRKTGHAKGLQVNADSSVQGRHQKHRTAYQESQQHAAFPSPFVPLNKALSGTPLYYRAPRDTHCPFSVEPVVAIWHRPPIKQNCRESHNY